MPELSSSSLTSAICPLTSDADVLVIGSGAAGLACALVAAVGGLKVTVIEKSRYVGGTSAMSGACTWVPANHHMAALGEADSVEEALTYIRAVSPPGWRETEDALWQAFVRHAPDMLRFVEAKTPLRFAVGLEPDPYAEAPGGKKRGRCVSPRPLPMRVAGPFAGRIRPSTMMQSFNYDDLADHHAAAQPWPVLRRFGPRALWNKLSGRRSMGGALIAGLVRGCLDHGVELRLETPARGLVVEDGRVVGARVDPRAHPFESGAEVESEGRTETLRARRGVLLATGGFEWNPELMARYLPGPVELTASPSTNTGDGQLMAAAVGAALAHMDQALIHPVKAATYEGRPAGAPSSDLKLPHIMLVNRHGKRFVNEVQVNIGLAFAERDPATGHPVNLPAWRIFDRQYVRKYPRVLPLSRVPPGFYTAGSLAELARLIGVDAAGLEESARRMNEFARAGRDEDFGRGSHYWDVTTIGDPRHGPCPVLGTIETPPFHAIPYHAAYLGTKGGPRTNEHGQVLRPDGSRIAGLYAAGNAMANPIGSKGVGTGTTIGPCLTWGYICGLSMLRENA